MNRRCGRQVLERINGQIACGSEVTQRNSNILTVHSRFWTTPGIGSTEFDSRSTWREEWTCDQWGSVDEKHGRSHSTDITVVGWKAR